ncbi:MAG TPA: KEOPS complex subunit Cgi121 [Candidatus Thermoplasmatota archaeon]|nr:KEOPS complex subunit Cgi121 [Candidatus Thermoplasmatota archaeon]
MTFPKILGYRGTVRDVRALVQRAQGLTLVRADRVYGRDHLLHAAALAQRALAEGRARSADVQTETLLYAAGERQIGKALDFMGLRDGMDAVAVVSWGADPEPLARALGWTRDDGVLAGGPAVLDAFGVAAEERAMLPPERWGEFILERVALTDVLKA